MQFVDDFIMHLGYTARNLKSYKVSQVVLNSLVCAFFLVLVANTVFAEARVVDGEQCVNAISKYEKEYGIPTNLLRSIAIVESGQWDRTTKKWYPWPWTVNIDGISHFFSNKREAVNFIKEKLKSGVKNIDVGCNQISIRHHGENFSNIDQIINPKHNSRYAAQFLKSHFQRTNDWASAVGRYHSCRSQKAKVYINKVFARWQSIAKDPKYSTSQTTIPLKHINHNSAKVQNVKKYDRYADDIIVFASHM
ncbi:lytic transglycosylase domain-containing protein [Rickettsiales endosymbiont of Peranema trichophorum]|uniref:transglycosylase SLT domain-containing protein n=1 Tax=Rickettsiales endosymbiont of Peranema trichophorum TaxID=2486577 RepID=UPI001023038C|nr:transglycosylase SLT domain-containing protein [Rickettsiales endosymbiont of Peranema trichophorum]RZI47267.1 lytic transglycosylase domain-containing protein [Rickettsiales endosymbiont of Peranema trichophorum]